jgi:uncharacterized membrane protein (DUF4010 family)
MDDAAILELFQRLGLALGIGFLVGVERGWRHRAAPEGSRAAGLRTHAVVGLFGGVAGALTPAIGAIGFAALLAAFAAPWVLFKLREADRDQDISVTGTLGGILVFALGAMATLGDMRIAAAGGVALTALYAFKSALHQWLTKLSWEEIRSCLLILAATAIALPLLPNRAIDPWGYFNPRELWLLTILVATASFAGYVAVKLLGARGGLAAGAAAGALVSSTLATVEVGRRVKAGAPAGVGIAAACLASGIGLARIFVLVLVAAAPLMPFLWKPLGAAILIYAAIGLMFWRKSDKRGEEEEATPLQNPLELKAVLQFAGLLAAAILVGRIASSLWGEAGLLPFAATVGIADVDAVTLASGALNRSGVDAQIAAHAVLVAAAVNAASKTVLARASGGWGYAFGYGGASLVAALAAGGLLLLEAYRLIPI